MSFLIEPLISYPMSLIDKVIWNYHGQVYGDLIVIFYVPFLLTSTDVILILFLFTDVLAATENIY